MVKKNRIFKKVFKDIFSIMPFIVIILVLLGLLSALISIIQIELFSNIIDQASVIYNQNKVTNDIFVLISLYILSYILITIIEKINEKILKIDLLYKSEIFHKRLSELLVKLPLEICDNPDIKKDFWKAKDAVYQSRMLNVVTITFDFVILLFKIIGISIVLGRYDYRLVFLGVISIIPAIIVKIIGNKKLYQLRNTQIPSLMQRNYFSNLLIDRNYAKEIRLLQCEDFFINKNFKYNDNLYKENNKILQPLRLQISLCELIKIIFYGISIFISVYLFKNNKIELGALSACFIAFQNMQNYSQALITNFINLNENLKYSLDFYSFLENTTVKNTKIDDFIFENSITLKDVSFKYFNKNNNALSNINIHINQGEKIAIVGENGSGKTTLVKMILGLYSPSCGKVLYNNQDIDIIAKENIYRDVSLITQDFVKYSFTLRENIGISNIENINEDNLIKESLIKVDSIDLLEKICLDEELGLEFGGKEISIGEWQKIALARAIFKESKIIALDEPTSSLDPNTEYYILTKFLEMINQKTALIVSHRIGLCPLVDKIIVMDKGQIVEIGTHDELICKNGKYNELWISQSRWYIK